METHEHIEHAAESGRTRAAILIAVLAACLAVSEQGAKHAEIRLEEGSIGAVDAWAQYQAKSVRSAMARDLADLAEVMPGASPQATALAARLRADQRGYEHGTGGKDDIAARARKLEEQRDHAMMQAHGFDNAAAAFELAIVLTTASAITLAAPLLVAGACLGVAGLVLAALSVVAPGMAALFT